MSRRKFLSWFGIGAASIVAVPAAFELLPEHLGSWLPSAPGRNYQYFDYSNFVRLENFSAEQEKMLSDCAAELGHRAGLIISELHKHQCRECFDV